MRVEDYGKVAATFVNTKTGEAIRIVPQRECRQLACDYASETKNKWEAQLLGYQSMPVENLLSFYHVHLTTPIEQIISCAGVKAICDVCGEEIMNEREVKRDDMTLCRSCAGEGYYLIVAENFLPAQTNLIAR
ncbi:MAG: TraR/DksA C4-type zinc finger protein [Chloroflexi bacterium]|nr:TraR/DksA C4-type zinc finger protein [Chloroflexota bacterium]